MRALVTGGAGYFGGILARHLAARGAAVTSLDRLADPAPDARIAHTRADLRLPEQVREVFRRHGPFEVVFHCAALMGHELPDPRDLWACNVEGTRNLVEAAIEAGTRKIVNTSTICAYGRPFDHPVGEDEPVCPIDDYGRSKVAAEQVLQAAADRIDGDSLRCPTIVSEGRLGMLAILFEFIREGRRVYLVGDGRNRYQFVYAPDLAEACWLAARAPGSYVFHVGSERVKPLREVYQAVIEAAGSRSRLVPLPALPATLALRSLHALGLSPLGPYHSRLISGSFEFDTRRIRQALGWRPTRTNDEMLCEAYRYYVSHGAGAGLEVSAHRRGARMGILRLVKWLS